MRDRPVVSAPTFCERCGHAVEYHGVDGCDVEVRDYGDMDCGCTAYTHAAPPVSAPTDETARDPWTRFANGRKEVLIPGKGWHWTWCMSVPMVGLPTGECDCREARDDGRPSVGAGT